MTETTNQLPRIADVGRHLHLAAITADRAATALNDAVAGLRLAASADSSLAPLLESLEQAHKAAVDVSSRLSREDTAETNAIQARTAEVKDLHARALPRIFEIDKTITRIKRTIELRQARDKERENELRQAGLSSEEISRAHKPLSSSEIELAHAEIETLQAEREAIGKFMSDGPRFDVELLRGTSLYPQPPAQAA